MKLNDILKLQNTNSQLDEIFGFGEKKPIKKPIRPQSTQVGGMVNDTRTDAQMQRDLAAKKLAAKSPGGTTRNDGNDNIQDWTFG